jgi:hypothetical protein
LNHRRSSSWAAIVRLNSSASLSFPHHSALRRRRRYVATSS